MIICVYVCISLIIVILFRIWNVEDSEAYSVSYLFFIVQQDWGKDELVGVGLKHFYFNSLAANYRV